jgi:hypothetical protein
MTTNEERPFVGAYWSARKETRHESAVRVAAFLDSIAEHPPLVGWRLTGRSRKAALAGPLEISVEAIEHQLRTNNRDMDGSVIEDLGFSLYVWNGNDNLSASFHVTCGGWSDYVNNWAVLSLPPQIAPIDQVTGKPLRTLLEKSVQVWDPDYAVVTSSEFMARKGGGMPRETGGWFAYECGRGIAASFGG